MQANGDGRACVCRKCSNRGEVVLVSSLIDWMEGLELSLGFLREPSFAKEGCSFGVSHPQIEACVIWAKRSLFEGKMHGAVTGRSEEDEEEMYIPEKRGPLPVMITARIA